MPFLTGKDLEELQQVIRGCILNDRTSQEKLYKQFYVSLFYMCRRFFRNEHEAIESVNDGMMKVFENIGTYQADKGSFFNWTYTIVRNTALDKLKTSVAFQQRYNGPGATDAVNEAGSDYNPLKALEQRDIYIMLDELSPATRVVCVLFYIEGYAIKEIAQQLGISAGTVKWHLSESRKNLKTIFKRHFNE